MVVFIWNIRIKNYSENCGIFSFQNICRIFLKELITVRIISWHTKVRFFWQKSNCHWHQKIGAPLTQTLGNPVFFRIQHWKHLYISYVGALMTKWPALGLRALTSQFNITLPRLYVQMRGREPRWLLINFL